jgi:hypothetical protein
MEKYHGNTVEYWKQNAEEDYIKTPISVLKYITVLEEQAEQLCKHVVINSFSMQDLMLYYQDAENCDFTSKVIDVLNNMINNR